MVHIEKIEKQVPFSQSLFVHFDIHEVPISDLPSRNRVEKNYLAWQTVRKKTNPYFVEGTGFEGYLVGTCADPASALDAILKANQHILDAIARLYRFESLFLSRLMKTLSGELDDPEAIHIWSAYLGAELGLLRVHVPRNRAAILFQNQTYQIVAMLPPIAYHKLDHHLFQTYAVGYLDNAVIVVPPHQAKLQVKEGMLNPSQQTAWRVASNIGRFGHPLVRKYLDNGWH